MMQPAPDRPALQPGPDKPSLVAAFGKQLAHDRAGIHGGDFGKAGEMNAAFYDVVRPMFGGALEPVQVQVMDGLFEAGKHLPRAHLAYIFATAYGEAKMIPRRENMNYSAARIRQVWPSRPAAVQYAGKPKALANEVYGGRLGNRRGTDDGWDYRGGGIDQLTGRDNYAKVGIADKPQAILEPGKAVASIIHGMTTGRYTGKKLADYDKAGGFDFVGARAIVNGDGRLNGEKYAGYAQVLGGNAGFWRNDCQGRNPSRYSAQSAPGHACPHRWRIVACAASGGAGGYVRKGQVMDWAPITRIIVRYVVGVIVGMDAGEALAGDPDVITVAALVLGAAVEGAYALAKRKGWTT